MAVTSRFIAFTALCSFVTTSAGLAQSTPPYGPSAGLPAAAAPQDSTSIGLSPAITGPKNPAVQTEHPMYQTNPSNYSRYSTNPSNYSRYQSDPLNYPSSASMLPRPRIDPNSAAAQRQSGLTQADATSLIRSQGYTSLGEVQADPNSIWVWQADAMKNGRRVHLGIDNHGNLLNITAGQNQPCTTPGVWFGAGPMGVGSRLSDATNCAAR